MALTGQGPRMLERVIHWTLGGRPQPPFLCTPDDLQDLVRGHLLSQGVIRSDQDILALTAHEDCVSVSLRGAPLEAQPIDGRLAALRPLDSGLCLPLSELRQAMLRLTGEERYFGTHRLMLLGPAGELVREDIGRHNAADKVIGAAVREGWDPGQCALGATGRISLEILCKAAATGIPVIFSKKYASDLSSEWAERLGIAIVGEVLGERPGVTGAAWRIEQA